MDESYLRKGAPLLVFLEAWSQLPPEEQSQFAALAVVVQSNGPVISTTPAQVAEVAVRVCAALERKTKPGSADLDTALLTESLLRWLEWRSDYLRAFAEINHQVDDDLNNGKDPPRFAIQFLIHCWGEIFELAG